MCFLRKIPYEDCVANPCGAFVRIHARHRQATTSLAWIPHRQGSTPSLLNKLMECYHCLLHTLPGTLLVHGKKPKSDVVNWIHATVLPVVPGGSGISAFYCIRITRVLHHLESADFPRDKSCIMLSWSKKNPCYKTSIATTTKSLFNDKMSYWIDAKIQAYK